jgi:hypothetical protein
VGIGKVPTAAEGFRFHHVNGARNSATYMQTVTDQPFNASAMPSTGTYVQGAFVKNTSPSSSAFIHGWLRLTTGTAHVLGTDWAIVALSVYGTYTPTLTGVTNIASSIAAVCHYLRTGNEVRVWGAFQVTCTAAASTASEIDISLPIASNLAAAADLAGVAQANAIAAGARIQGDATNDRAGMFWVSGTTASHSWGFEFSYEIK